MSGDQSMRGICISYVKDKREIKERRRKGKTGKRMQGLEIDAHIGG